MAKTPYSTILEWQSAVASSQKTDAFIAELPKVELHIHIEGSMTSALRWHLGQRNQLPLRNFSQTESYATLPALQSAYHLNNPLQPRSTTGSKQMSAFFETYYGAMDVLRTERDFYDLAMDYFTRFAAMAGRYAEVFFDPQAHTRRGIGWDVFMPGLERARVDAERELAVKCSYIMCFLRDLPPADAEAHYEAALPYRNMIVGIGLDSNEYGRPPLLFQDVFTRARKDGFQITAHCDVTQQNCLEHIRQVACELGGSGAGRIDHGLDIADSPALLEIARTKRVLLTICPWAYVRHVPAEKLFADIRKLVGLGLRVCIASDSPAYMEEQWLVQNLLLIRLQCGFTDEEIWGLQRNAILGCWADEQVKQQLMDDLHAFGMRYGVVTS
ncbi:hypothetical protein BP6252_08343 [Coleophoma cylindrospora]|uniref:Adenosine deaminase domain-containing protein n=1 Tax=Coleophoma cylindrospora TaxID=1849047 RepID=A0A3D8R5L6_9HELO|nr:hypothetical protein BP6252_08343 [Coleophoma cylindrospora]